MNWYNLYFTIYGNSHEWKRRIAMLMAIAWRELANSQNTWVTQCALGLAGYNLLQHMDNNLVPVPFDARALVNQ